MAANKLKISRTVALEKLDRQITKGQVLGKKGIEFIKNIPNHSNYCSEIDRFKIELEQWIDISQSALYEIYHSPKYGSDFKNHRASKREYVSSSWQPDIRFYLEYELLPKLEYLKILKENTFDLEEIDKPDKPDKTDTSIPETKDKVENVKPEVKKINIENYDFAKITVPQLLGLLSIPQIVKIISTIIGLLVVGFWIGFYANENTSKKSNEDLIKVVNDLSKEVKQLRVQSDSLENILRNLPK